MKNKKVLFETLLSVDNSKGSQQPIKYYREIEMVKDPYLYLHQDQLCRIPTIPDPNKATLNAVQSGK